MKTREQVKKNLQEKEDEIYNLVKEMVENSHTSKNCHRLYVHTNGAIWIGEEASDNSWAVISGTIEPIAVLLKTYNSCGCNCDWCSDEDYTFDISDFYDDIEMSIASAIEAIEEIEEGYFDDEK